MASSGTGQCSSFTSWLDMGTIADPMQYASDRIPTPNSASFLPIAPGTILAKNSGYTRSTAIPNHRKASTPTTVVSDASLTTSILCGPLLSHRPGNSLLNARTPPNRGTPGRERFQVQLLHLL